MKTSRINYLFEAWGFPCAMIVLGIVLVFSMCRCSDVTLAEVQTTADKLITNVKAYAQTLGNMLQTASADVAKAAPQLVSVANLANQLANSWGMAPSSPAQQDTYNKVLADITLVGNNASALNSLLTSIQRSGVVPAISTAGDASTMTWETPKGFVVWTKVGNAKGSLADYELPQDVRIVSLDNSISEGVGQ